jgi:diguanylate cyclase (GGDEF)-like protein
MSQAPSGERTETQQRLRRQRMRMTILATAAAVALTFIVAYFGFVRPAAAWRFALVAAAFLAGFHWLLRSGWNLRLRDASMTVPMLAAAGLTISIVVYEGGEAQPAFLALYVMAFMFGMYWLEVRRLALMAAFYVGCYGAVVALHLWLQPQAVDPARELLRLGAFAFFLAWFTVHGAYLGRLRSELRAARRRLAHELDAAQTLAFRDALTGCYNRRHAMAQLEREVRAAGRGTPFTLGMLDLDHFKAVNDSFGHAAGDEVLKAFAACVGGALRGTDLLARIGGEEFLVIFSNTTAPSARAVAERLRERVAALRIPALPEGRGITVSVGLAEHRAGADIEQTLARTDRALYRAKEEGRDRVVVDG